MYVIARPSSEIFGHSVAISVNKNFKIPLLDKAKAYLKEYDALQALRVSAVNSNVYKYQQKIFNWQQDKFIMQKPNVFNFQ